MRAVRPIAAAMLAVTGLTGCFEYVPVVSAPPRQGEEVRLALSAPASVELEAGTVNGATTVNGWWIPASADSVLLSARSVETPLGQRFPGLGATVRFPRSGVAVVQRKRISFLRTAALVAVAVGAATLLGNTAVGGSRGPDNGPGGNPR